MTAARDVSFLSGETTLEGSLAVPDGAGAIVVFAHGSGSGRHSSRNRRVADELNEARLATLLIDLLSEDEERLDQATRELRFDIRFLAGRLIAATTWLSADDQTSALRIGYFGASTGAAAALVAAAERPETGAIVSRGGWPDLPRRRPRRRPRAHAPDRRRRRPAGPQAQRRRTQPVAGGSRARSRGGGHPSLRGTRVLEEVARHARDWFLRHLSQT